MQKDNKTIAITLRFWTDDLKIQYPQSGEEAGPKVCWDSGVAILEANKDKGIASSATPIQCYEDIIPAIKNYFEKVEL